MLSEGRIDLGVGAGGLREEFEAGGSPDFDARGRVIDEFLEAYKVLKDPEKRAACDRFGADWKAGQESRPPPGWERDVESAGGEYTDAGEFSDFFESLFREAPHRERWGH